MPIRLVQIYLITKLLSAYLVNFVSYAKNI